MWYLIFLKINFFAFVYYTWKLFKKCIFMASQFFHVFYSCAQFWAFQSLINCKFVYIKTKGLSHPSVYDLHSLRHLCRLSGNNPSSTNPLLATCATVRISSPFKAKLFFVPAYLYIKLGNLPYLPQLPPPLLSFMKDSFALSLTAMPLVTITFLNLV